MSELETNACNRQKELENACDQVTSGFGRAFDWLRKWREFLNQSRSVVKQNQSKREITFDTQFKTALLLNLPFETLISLNCIVLCRPRLKRGHYFFLLFRL